jgi:hypothetical protein
MSKNLDYPVQTKAVYNILRYLVEKKALDNDPYKIEMFREDRKSIMPCRKGLGELDLEQLEWAKDNGKWWFTGPIEKLQIKMKEKSLLNKAETNLLEQLAIDANFILQLL